MDTGIHIGPTIHPGGLTDLASSITSIMREGFETHADQETVQLALRAFGDATKVTGTSLTGCSIVGDQWDVTEDEIDDGAP